MRLSVLFLFGSILFSNFQIHKSESTISYIGSHPFHDWKGITTEIEIETDCQEKSVDCHATISVPVISFISGNNNRDSNMLFQVDGFSYPIVSISFPEINISQLLTTETSTMVTGEIDFHGFKIMHEIPLTLTAVNDTISIQSNFTIQLGSFEVDRPSLLMIPIKNDIKIDVNISGGFIKL